MRHARFIVVGIGYLLTACAAAAGGTPPAGGGTAHPAAGVDAARSPTTETVFASHATVRAGTISVSGDAEVKVVPDEILLTVGMETWDKDLEAAKGRNDEVIRRALALVAQNGIDPRHVQTDFVQIQPRYETGYPAEPRFVGYFVTQALGVTLKDVGKYETLLSALLKAGINHVYGIEFRSSELRAHRDQARRLAIRAAREKAEAMAAEFGRQVGEPTSIREERIDAYSGIGPWSATNVSQNAIQAGSGSLDSGATMALGQVVVGARVAAEFSLR